MEGRHTNSVRPTLTILAAGLGRRYGGMKQLEPVGPGGETIMDYSVYDALRAGFGRAVFVIRPEMEAAFREAFGRRYERRLAVAYAFQRLDGLPAGFRVPRGREKPWGTGHAVLASADLIHEPFAVINADDFYGAGSFAALGEFLRSDDHGEVPTHAMVGFTLRDTLSDAGSVNRGCCRCTPDGYLERIVETVGVERHGCDARYSDQAGQWQTISGDTPVSMNTWGFRPILFEQLGELFEAFLTEHGASEKAEYHLPTAVQELMRTGRARVRVLRTEEKWFGVTHPQDKARVTGMIRRLIDLGVYPANLWR